MEAEHFLPEIFFIIWHIIFGLCILSSFIGGIWCICMCLSTSNSKQHFKQTENFFRTKLSQINSEIWNFQQWIRFKRSQSYFSKKNMLCVYHMNKRLWQSIQIKKIAFQIHTWIVLNRVEFKMCVRVLARMLFYTLFILTITWPQCCNFYWNPIIKFHWFRLHFFSSTLFCCCGLCSIEYGGYISTEEFFFKWANDTIGI